MILFSILNSIIKIYAYGNKDLFPNAMITETFIFIPFFYIFKGIFGIPDYDIEKKYDESISGFIADFRNTLARNKALTGYLALQVLSYIFFFVINYISLLYKKYKKKKLRKIQIQEETDFK